MRWASPPEKREIILVLLSITVYLLAYNIDGTLQTLGIDASATRGAVFNRLGLGKTYIGEDGRKPAGWRDSLENDIYGDWTWDKGHVAGSGEERAQGKGSGRHGAAWAAQATIAKIDRRPLTDGAVDDALYRWGDEIPLTTIVRQSAGYNILDNVFIYNGSVFLVTDTDSTLPAMSSIVANAGSGFSRWKTIRTATARRLMGSYGSMIRGVSWLSADSQPHNSTLFSLWRTYSSLDETITSDGLTTLPSPRRLIFPHNRFFMDEDTDFSHHWIRRRRFDTGFHPYLLKAAFPQLVVQYFEDWNDYMEMQVPFLFERLVVADRTVAEKAVSDGQPVFLPPFDSLPASPYWWEPVRRSLAEYLGVYDMQAKAKPVITYLHTQSEENSAKLSDVDHNDLANALGKMANKNGYELHVVSTQTSDTDWVEKMTAIAKSSVVVSVHGDHLMDGVFMRPSAHSTLVELFPADKFVKDRAYAARSLSLDYVTWRGRKSISRGSDSEQEFPATSSPTGHEDIDLDISAVVESIHHALSRGIASFSRTSSVTT